MKGIFFGPVNRSSFWAVHIDIKSKRQSGEGCQQSQGVHSVSNAGAVPRERYFDLNALPYPPKCTAASHRREGLGRN
jgi:hypothetical protein